MWSVNRFWHSMAAKRMVANSGFWCKGAKATSGPSPDTRSSCAPPLRATASVRSFKDSFSSALDGLWLLPRMSGTYIVKDKILAVVRIWPKVTSELQLTVPKPSPSSTELGLDARNYGFLVEAEPNHVSG